MHPAPPALTVVIPFFNEAESCQALLAELRGVLEAQPETHEVLAVDDGSTDATESVLALVAADWPALRILPFARNQGQAAALFVGMRAARGAAIVTMDGDGQNVPADIPRLVARLAEADLVAGIRAQRRDGWLRRMMSRIANGIRSRVLGDGMTDSGCALKAFRREVVDSFLPMRTLYSFMPALAVAAGFTVVQEPVQHRERRAGISKYGLLVMLWRPALDMLGVWWWRHRRFPPPVIAPRP